MNRLLPGTAPQRAAPQRASPRSVGADSSAMAVPQGSKTPRIHQRPDFLIGKQPRPRKEAHALAVLQRKHPPTALDHIDDQLRVLPVLVLRWAHVERRARDRAQQHVAVADDEIVRGITHWR